MLLNSDEEVRAIFKTEEREVVFDDLTTFLEKNQKQISEKLNSVAYGWNYDSNKMAWVNSSRESVIMKKDTDILHVTNGLGFLFTTEITLASDSKCTVKIISFEKAAPSKFRLHLAVAPTKMNDRYEWFLEKATEIGIQEITPIICDHSERKVINNERFDKILLAAMKQANELYLPKLNPLTNIKPLPKACVSMKVDSLELIFTTNL